MKPSTEFEINPSFGTQDNCDNFGLTDGQGNSNIFRTIDYFAR